MTRYLFLRITDSDTLSSPDYKAHWRLYDVHMHCVGRSHEPQLLNEISAVLSTGTEEDHKIIVLLRSDKVFISEAKIKQQHVRHLQSVISAAVEEQLAEPLENVSIAISEPRYEGNQTEVRTYSVAVINNNLLNQLIHVLNAAGLKPDSIIPESLLLSLDQKATLVLEDDHLLFSLPSSAASRMQTENFLSFFDMYLNSLIPSGIGRETQILQPLEVLINDSETTEQQALCMENLRILCNKHTIAMHLQSYGNDVFDWLCSQWQLNPLHPVNLLQKTRQFKGSLNALYQQRRLLAFIVIIWVTLHLFFNLGFMAYLSYETSKFQQQNTAIYHSLFPQDTQLVDLKSQMEQHLANVPVASTDEFMDMLSLFASHKNASDHLDISTVSYDAKKHELLLDVSSTDFRVFEQYKKEKTRNPDFGLEFFSVEKDVTGIHAKVRIWKRQH